MPAAVMATIVGGNTNSYEQALDVPRFDEEKLASSSLILADMIQKLPTKSIGGGMFSIVWSGKFVSSTSTNPSRPIGSRPAAFSDAMAEGVIRARQADFNKVLADYNVPLLDSAGKIIAAP